MKPDKRNRRAAHAHRRRGAGLVVALVTLLIISSTMAAIIHALLVDLRQTRQAASELQAHWLADSAVSRAAAQLRLNSSYEGETWRPVISAASNDEGAGVAEIRIERATEPDQGPRVVVDARYPDHPSRRILARRNFLISQPNDNPIAGASPQENAP